MNHIESYSPSEWAHTLVVVGSSSYSDVTTSLEENISFKDKKSSSENSGSDTISLNDDNCLRIIISH